MATFSDFKSNFDGGFRTNRFVITIGTDEYQYNAKSATIPDIEIDEIALKHQGLEFHIPADRKTQTWTCTIYLAGKNDKFEAYNRFYDLMNKYNNTGDNNKYNVDHLVSAGSVIQVDLYDSTDKFVKQFKLQNPWINKIGQLQLDVGSAELATFEVTFRYTYMIA